jgi:4-hydroxybenzoate polyprenyltransferase
LDEKKRTFRTWARLFRLPFLPFQIIIFGSMAVPVVLGLRIQISIFVAAAAALAVATHIFWFCYGTVLNDYWDQDIDRGHPFGGTPFTEGYFSEKEKKGVIRFYAVLAAICEIPQFAYIYLTHANPALDMVAFAIFIMIGFVLATVYSMPPVWAKRRFLGTTYTLLLVYVTGFLRFCLLFGGWNFIVLNGIYILGICGFLYIDHMITSLSLKDIGDVYADEKGGSRTLPLVLGLRPALNISIALLVMTMGAGVLLVMFGWLQWWFLLTYLGVICYYYLYREMSGWIEQISKDRTVWDKITIRRKFLAFGYIMNWGVWIPAFMLAFNGGMLV